jgi:hypothetical protein
LDSAVESGHKVDFQARGIKNDGWGDQDLVGFSKPKGQRVLLHELAVFFGAFSTHRGRVVGELKLKETKRGNGNGIGNRNVKIKFLGHFVVRAGGALVAA